MQGIAFVLLGLTFPSVLSKLELDVHQIAVKSFALPIRLNVDPDEVKVVRVFVSRNKGGEWKHHKDFDSSVTQFSFIAPKDGSYWFAVQVEGKDGQKEPESIEDLSPSRKILVNSERRSLKPNVSTDDVHKELEKLRRTVERQKKIIAELESAAQKKDATAARISLKLEVNFR